MGRITLHDRIGRLRQLAIDNFNYCWNGVWRDTRTTWKVNIVKTLSLSIRSFMDTDLQTQACALTYRTLLAIVPALAMIFAIGRGFGLQSLLTDQIYSLFPSQRLALEQAFRFVDSYLSQASEGLFVGVGIVFLLWTLISLLNSVEDAFNTIWRVRSGRSMWRKVTDYLAIFIVLPVLLICASGLTILMSTTLKNLLPYEFMKPAISFVFDLAGWVFTWLFFAGTYMLIPNAKVRFVNALLAGVMVGSAFQILQWLFMTGQMYVTKYNAIYGSFSFLPLMLIWLQLVWLFTLTGGLLCYASQNIGQFSYQDDIKNISREYRREVEITLMAIITKRFERELPPLTCARIAADYGLPVRLVTELALQLKSVGLINFIESKGELMEHPMQPAIDISRLTVGEVVRRIQTDGSSNFIPDFDNRYAPVVKLSETMTKSLIDEGNETALTSLDIKI